MAAPDLDLLLMKVEINYDFAGDAKNYCNTSFGLIKRQRKKAEIFNPVQFSNAILASTTSDQYPEVQLWCSLDEYRVFFDSGFFLKKGILFPVTEVRHIAFLAHEPGIISFRNAPQEPWLKLSLCTDEQTRKLPTRTHSLDDFEILPN